MTTMTFSMIMMIFDIMACHILFKMELKTVYAKSVTMISKKRRAGTTKNL